MPSWSARRAARDLWVDGMNVANGSSIRAKQSRHRPGGKLCSTVQLFQVVLRQFSLAPVDSRRKISRLSKTERTTTNATFWAQPNKPRATKSLCSYSNRNRRKVESFRPVFHPTATGSPTPPPISIPDVKRSRIQRFRLLRADGRFPRMAAANALARRYWARTVFRRPDRCNRLRRGAKAQRHQLRRASRSPCSSFATPPSAGTLFDVAPDGQRFLVS